MGGRRNKPSLKRSITAPLTGDALRASLRRLGTGTHALDASLPSSMRFDGLKLGTPAKTGPNVNAKTEMALSPFVLHLGRAPSPQSWLEDAGWRDVHVNLLPLMAEQAPAAAAVNDLALSSADIVGQLRDEAPTFAYLGAPLVFTRRTPVEFAPIPVPAELVAELLPVETLLPPEREVLVAALDLPEAEDEAESEMVSFEREGMVPEEGPIPTRPSWQFTWPSFPRLPRVTFEWQQAIGVFVLLSFACVLPLHAMSVVGGLGSARDRVTAASEGGVAELKAAAAAAANHDVDGARASFDRAAERFSTAHGEVSALGSAVSVVLSVIPNTGASVRAGTHLLAAGEALSKAGARLSEGVLSAEKSASSPTGRIALVKDYAASALPFLHDAELELARVKSSAIPVDQRDQFLELQQRLPQVVSGLESFLSFSDALLSVLGGNGTRHYLAIFQNNRELRPTGGFMGSFAELTVQDGKITAVNIPGGGTYDLQGSLKKFVAAPDPLRLLSARFEFQDTNWFADFPTSARKILSFYQAAGGASVDGVVAVNASYVADLLTLLGDIDMPAYGRTITGKNFIDEAQKIVETEYDKTINKPKAFIGDLAPKVLERASALSGGEFLTLLEHVNQGLSRRDIQLYFPDETLQRQAIRLGWDGGVRWTDRDYLMVVHTNLGGGKTDAAISEESNILVNIASDGSVTNTVTITRTHTGTSGDIYGGLNNVDYLRLYVPKGSKLLSASGFSPPGAHLFEKPESNWSVDDDVFYAEQTQTVDPVSATDIYEESGKTVFGNWVQTKPGAQSTVTFTYKLPFKVEPTEIGIAAAIGSLVGITPSARYTLLVQRQSGAAKRTVHARVETPENMPRLWSSQDPAAIELPGDRDGFFGAVFHVAK